MKILFLAPEPFFEVRGTPINIRQVLYSIGGIGHHIDLLTYHIGEDAVLKNVNIHRIAKIPFIKHVPIGPSPVKVILDFLLFFKTIKMVISSYRSFNPLTLILSNWWRGDGGIPERYDLIHAVEESVFIAFLIRKVFGIPYIYDMDSCISDQLAYTGKLRSRLLLKLVSAWEEIVIRNSLAVLTVCSSLSKFAARTAPGKKIFQIEDCAVEFSQERTGFSREKLGISKDSIIVMYVGNFEVYQGIEMLLESMAFVMQDKGKNNVGYLPEAVCTDRERRAARSQGAAQAMSGTVVAQNRHGPSGSYPVKLLLIGGEPQQIQKMREYADRIGILDSVLFHGKRAFEEIPSYLELADILVSPRLKGTNTPMKIFYYLASGKPIVATDLPMHNQILNDESAILAKPDAHNFSREILCLIRDKALRDRIGNEGRKLFESKYSAEIFEEKVRRAYEFAAVRVQSSE